MAKTILKIIFGSIFGLFLFALVSYTSPQQSFAYYKLCYIPPMAVVCKHVPLLPDVCAPTVFCLHGSQHFESLSDLKKLVTDDQEAMEAVCNAGIGGLPWASNEICERVPGLPNPPDITSPRITCSDLTKDGRGGCESSLTKGKCFWYSGGLNDTPECRDNNGKMNGNETCRDGGHCYQDQKCYTNPTSSTQYCSSYDQTAGTCPVGPQLGNAVSYSCSQSSCPTDPKQGGKTQDPSLVCNNGNPCCVLLSNVNTSLPGGGGPGTGGGQTLPAPGVGYCAGANRENPQAVSSATCGVNNAPFDSESQYCIQKFGGSLGNFFRCPAGGSAPAPGQQGPATGPCALEKGGVKSYVNSFCDKKPYTLTGAQAGEFCKAVYSDKYICNNTDASGKNIEDYYEAPGATACSSSPWCPTNAGAICKSANGSVQDCKALFGSNYSCTNDYIKPGATQTTRCCADNKRWCPTSSTCVSDADGCGGLSSGIGQSCTSTSECSDASLGATCKPWGSTGVNTCQWPGNVAPTPTPGAPSNQTCAQKIAAGTALAGCECPNGGGCGPGLGCYPEAQKGNITTGPFFCAPTGQRWCSNTQAATTTPNSCGAGTPFVPTPAPVNLGYQADCPAVNSIGQQNSCDAGSCQPGFIQNTRIGTGGTNGNQICSEVKGTSALCCTKSATQPTTAAPSSAPLPGGGSTSDLPGCPWDGLNTCKSAACSNYPGLRQNNGAGANAACLDAQAGSYCCRPN